MEEVFPAYHVFINHRGPDVKKTLASLIHHALETHGLRVFLDDRELQVGDSLTPAIKSAICSASVHIAIFSKTYAKSTWCLDELLWMLDSDPTFTKIIPIFYDIEPSSVRHVEKGPYGTAIEEHRSKNRVTDEGKKRWINALEKVSAISGVVFMTEKDDHGERLTKIVENVLKRVGSQQPHVCDYPVGLREAAEHFEKEVLIRSELSGTHVVAIVGPGGSGKSTLAIHLYNSKCSRFKRCCFLSDVSKRDLPSLQEALLRDLLHDQNLCIKDTRRGRTLLQDRLLGLPRVLIVFDDIDNRDQIKNLLFVKDYVGDGSLILVTSRDQALFYRSVKIYKVELLEEKHAQELFCLHAFADNRAPHDLQDMVGESVIMCGGFPLALKLLAGELHNERDPRTWKKQLKSLRKQMPEGILNGIVNLSYESLAVREKEAFLDIAHFLVGEDRDLAERVLDGFLNDDGFRCLQMLHDKCLVEFESADIIRRRALGGESVIWSIGVWRGRKGSFKIRMHDLVRDLARQIGRQELPLRLCCSNDSMISKRVSGSHGSAQQYDVRGIRRDEDHLLPEFLQNQDIYGLNILAVQNSSIQQQFKSLSGDLIWFRLNGSKDTLNIPSTLLLRSLKVLELHGVSPKDFCNLFYDREPPSQLRAFEVAFNRDFESASTAGPSTVVSTKHGATSESLQPPINIGQWFQAFLGNLNFKNLVKIVLQDIRGLKTLPIKFEEVRNLRHVDLSGCTDLEVLPHSFTEDLSQLQYLALGYCCRLVLQDLGKISTLEYLDFEGCSMLTEMPKGTEVQKSLKHLNVVNTWLMSLPHNLEQLEDLEELHIGSSELTELPSSLYNLSRLTDLTLIGCNKLLFIDNCIEKLVHLECFRMYHCGVRALPEKIACLNMKILDVQWCPLDLEQLLTGAYPVNMPVESSRAQGSTGEGVHLNRSGLKTNLIIRESRILHIHVPQAESLFPNLETVDPSYLGNMPVESSRAQGSTGQDAHPNRSGCLTNLIIRHSRILHIHIPQAESLFPNLETVDLSYNHLLTEIGRLPGNLISLKLTNCLKLTTLYLSNLGRLEVLDISGCGELRTLNVEGLRSIQVIKANGCCELRNLLEPMGVQI